ncbi:MAG: hydrogenase nickel incorporation protein HypB [Candidatus Aminicenantales bacterium]
MSRKEIDVLEDLLGSNKKIAAEIRRLLGEKEILTVNFMSSPGSGKTSLLEKIIDLLFPRHRLAVIEGDIETDRDAARIRAKGVPAWQITTGGACHLEAKMVGRLMKEIPAGTEFLFIENVGNLVCPASYDLGESLRCVLLSVPEGEDKPKKYPKAFLTADCLVITKLDLLAYVPYDLEKVKREALEINPGLKIFGTSALTGEGVEEFSQFLLEWRRRLGKNHA